MSIRAVAPKFARPNTKASMERATESRLGLIAYIGSDLADGIACHRQPPPSKSKPQLGEESERSNT
jgi:hypothetical protein